MDNRLHEKLMKANEQEDLESWLTKEKQDLLDDLHAFLDDLDSETLEKIDMLPSILDELPNYTNNWTVQELWSAIRDR